MNVLRRFRIRLLLACMMAVVSATAKAEFLPKDGQILGRTLGYAGDGMTGIATVGIVYVPDSKASREEAEHILGVIGDGMITGRIQLRARLVPVAQLAAVTGVDALYITRDLTGAMETIFAAARRLRAPTVSIDMTCVIAGDCVVGFTSQPTVQILLNQGAAERIGVHFLQAFRMLVREK